MKTYFATTSRKVMLLLYAAALLAGAGILVRSHRGGQQASYAQAAARTGAVTSTLSAQIDGKRILRLLATYDSRGMLIKNTQDAWYYVLHESLRKSADAAGLGTPLLVVAYDTLKQELQTVATSADTPAMREAYGGPGAAQVRAYLRHGSTAAVNFADGGTLVSVDAVKTVDGSVVAALVATVPPAALQAGSWPALVRETGIAALIFALLGFLLFRRVGQLVRGEEAQRAQLQERHAGVTDSIAYAGKIQSALIPPPERFREQFKDFFVLNRPRDLVSGDFHWYHRINAHECLVATADCTGHGLPGAMMAAICCSLLNDLARETRAHAPADMLAELSRRLVATLHQEGRRTGAGDGMDIALCRVDRRNREILFAGAFRPLYWMHQGQLKVINGDRQPVGGAQHGNDRRFTQHRLHYAEGDSIYLFSDGLTDQFGGPERRKFMAARFNNVLLANQGMPMAMQADALDRAFREWKGAQPQVDDVCVLGIAV